MCAKKRPAKSEDQYSWRDLLGFLAFAGFVALSTLGSITGIVLMVVGVWGLATGDLAVVWAIVCLVGGAGMTYLAHRFGMPLLGLLALIP